MATHAHAHRRLIGAHGGLVSHVSHVLIVLSIYLTPTNS